MNPIDDVVLMISSLQVGHWSEAAVTALVIYDAIITLDEEVKYFWKPPISLINVTVFLMRSSAILSGIMNFYPYLHVLDGFSCAVSDWAVSLLDLIIILCMDYILFLRVRALYSINTQCKGLILCMRIAYFANALVALGSLIAYLRKAGVVAVKITDGIETCGAMDNPIGLRCLYWSALLTFESILLGMALYKAAHIRKCLGLRGLKLMKAVVIDQTMCYALVITCGVVNIISNVDTLSAPEWFAILNILGSAQLLPLQGVRMLTRLKKIAEKIADSGTIPGVTSNVSVAEFRTYSVHSDAPSAELAWSLGE